MKYERFNDTIVMRGELGDELLTIIEEVCLKENVKLAEVTGIGATDHATLGFYKVKEQKYYPTTLQGEMEIVNIVGNVSQKDGKYYGHFHAVLGGEGGRTYGGHLNEAYISATAEIFIRIIDGQIDRKVCKDTGLNILDL